MPLRKLILLSTLYISQFLPLGFFTEAFPVYLREVGYSLELIGAIHLVLLPWMFKFLWAPFVDRFGNTRIGHYRLWILLMQMLVAVCLVVISFLDIQTGLKLIIFFVVCLSIFAATQDIATDALAVGMLTRKEQGIGNGIQNASHFLGSMLGGGLMLIIIEKSGWENSLWIMAVLVLLPLIPVLLHKENNAPPEKKASIRSNLDFFLRPGNASWLYILIIVPFGATMVDFIFKPFLVDKGFSLEEIGYVRGIIGLSSGFIGAIAGGLLVKSVGRKKIVVNFAFFVALSSLAYLVPLYIEATLWTIIIVSVITKFFVGMFTTSMFTLIMERSKPGTAGTDFTVQIAVLTLSSHGLAAPLGGFIGSFVGYAPVFIAGVLLAFLSVVVLRAGLKE
ncbi:MAG: MFS transporter [Ignavibacteriae bacterium]|nr:MFS transporter [Ignavibacteriota bacterium]MCB9242706.1 MFS transporter [Ignavibacteriales bacterium]